MKIAPFKATRPGRDKVHLVATRSYVSYTPLQLRKKLHENPFSFLHIIHPDMGSRQFHTSANEYERYERVRKKFEEFKQSGILESDVHPGYYIYRQVKKGHVFTGLIAAVSIRDYTEGRVKKHEQTLSKRQERFTAYLEHTRINAEPVLLTYQGKDVLEDLYKRHTTRRPEYDFTQTTLVRHKLWVVDQPEDIALITAEFDKIPSLYIADGHHRCASSELLQKKLAGKESESTDYFLSLILHESNIKIYDFNRLVRDIGPHSTESFVDALSRYFTVAKVNKTYRPVCKGEFSMYLDHQWYRMVYKPDNDFEKLDAQILTDTVLEPILGIKDLRKDKRIAFLEGPQGAEGLKKLIDRKRYKVAFGLFPVSMDELKSMADRDLTMPPKSTWIEPKLRSGLVIYELT